MFGYHSPYGQARPIAQIGQIPVTLTLALAALQCVTLIAGVFLLRAGWMDSLIFSSSQVLGGEVWRLLSYGLANDVRSVHPLWFLLGLFFFYLFGGMVEVRLGPARFAILYGALWIALPLLLIVGVPLFGPGYLAGSSMVHLGCFIAFAALFPGMPVLFALTAKWVAAGYAGILALQMAANSAWGQLWALLGLSVLAVWLVRVLDGSEALQPSLAGVLDPVKKLARVGSRPRLRVVPPPEDPERVVDALLDKISKRGIGSLTSAERRQLEAARIALIKRDERR